MPDTSEERRRRVRETIRLAARYVDQKGRGRPVHWTPVARVTRLDADGNPAGPPRNIGPIIFSTSFRNVDDDLMRKMFGFGGRWLHDGKPILPGTHTDPRLCSGCAWEPSE